jgi:hypothetical protein
MNYKGKFEPSEILCPGIRSICFFFYQLSQKRLSHLNLVFLHTVTYVYVPFDKEVRQKLDEFGYAQLAPSEVKEPPVPTLEDLKDVPLFYEGHIRTFNVLQLRIRFLSSFGFNSMIDKFVSVKEVAPVLSNLQLIQELLLEYVNAAGSELSKRIVFVLDRSYIY